MCAHQPIGQSIFARRSINLIFWNLYATVGEFLTFKTGITGGRHWRSRGRGTFPPRNWVHTSQENSWLRRWAKYTKLCMVWQPNILINCYELSGGYAPRTTHQGFCPWTALGDFRSPDTLCHPPPNPGYATGGRLRQRTMAALRACPYCTAAEWWVHECSRTLYSLFLLIRPSFCV